MNEAVKCLINYMNEIELSIVIPCLNEADTLATCLKKCQTVMQRHGLAAEVIVADNGSTDVSLDIARAHGARVVPVQNKGYGSALMGGIEQARGRYILMADADDSYDFLETMKFLEKIREGYDLVQGCRLPWGGGTVNPGAMPWSHRWIGNPMFSTFCRTWFGAPIHDVYCGMRMFSKSFYQSLDQQCTGMEFATEMIIKASLFKARIAEVPITLHKDGRIAHPPHLKTVRDGWRTLRFFLLYSPRWLFLIPGALLILLGLLAYGLALPGVAINGITFDLHTLLYGSVMMVCGYQSILFAVMTKTFAMNERLMPEDPRLLGFFKVFYLERGVTLGALAFVVGLGVLFWSLNLWRVSGFGALDYAYSMRRVIPSALLIILGFQTVMFSFFVSILGLAKR